MATLKYSGYPPGRTETDQKFLQESIQDKACEIGCVTRLILDQTIDHWAGVPAPVTMYPSLFPKSCFLEAQNLQSAYNQLYTKIACDISWLEKTHSKIVEIDDFLKQLWKIHYDIVKEGGYKHTLSLGIFRSDYMVHFNPSGQEPPQIKQVEFNTIASSFAGLSSRVTEIHKRIFELGVYPAMPEDWSPENPASETVANGLVEAHKAYIGQSPQTQKNQNKCVIFIVQDRESNVYDQRHVENLLWQQNVPVNRVVFGNILQELKVDQDGTLLYYPPRFSKDQSSLEVSVVYYRAGYGPTEYQTPEHWSARALIEKSKAIKCPTVLTQLAGTKKVQQVLENPDPDNLLQGFHTRNDETAEKQYQELKRTFVAMYPMDQHSEMVTKLKDPEFAKSFVLKPQREGGGNNIYREDITKLLSQGKAEDLAQYILMEMIEPPPQKNLILRNGQAIEGNVICELGIYGTTLWKVDATGGESSDIKIKHNTSGGYLLRTKTSGVSEGGVAAGFGSLDSLCLVENSAIC